MPVKYQLLALGPDDRFTYAECWGATATGGGRLIKEASRLADLTEAAGKMGHQNWVVRNHTRGESLSPQDFWDRIIEDARPH